MHLCLFLSLYYQLAIAVFDTLLDDTNRTNELRNDPAILQLSSVNFFSVSFLFILDGPHTIGVTQPEILQKLENYSNYLSTR